MTLLELLLIFGAGGLLLAGALWLRLRVRGAFVVTNPRYRELLAQAQVVGAGDFLSLPAVIISGHPDRNVAQVTLGPGSSAVACFLKREHRVLWRDRLASAWAGFCFVSKSQREAVLLKALDQAGIGCPVWIAYGEDGKGKAFLLTRDLTGSQELRHFLADSASEPKKRHRLAGLLGTALARLHAAGLEHVDLYAKHVFVDPVGERFHFLDWQRSRRRRRLAWHQRRRDLAALDATLANDLATSRERLACLRAYLKIARHEDAKGTKKKIRCLARAIRQEAERLLRRRHIREIRQAPLVTGTQNLIWLDGEALCVTRAFQTELKGCVPDWLCQRDRTAPRHEAVTRSLMTLSDMRKVRLVQRQRCDPVRGLWAWLRRRPFTSPELRQAGTLFRLQRYGVVTPQLLAVGQRQASLGRLDSFLLTEPQSGTVDLAVWLRERRRDAHGNRERWQLVRETARVLRRIHDAGCSLEGDRRGLRLLPLAVRQLPGEPPAVVVNDLEGLRTRHHMDRSVALRDLQVLRGTLSIASRTDALRFLLTYLDTPRLTPPARAWVWQMARRRTPQRPTIPSSNRRTTA